MVLDLGNLDRPTVHDVTTFHQGLVNEGLRSLLLAPERGVAHQALRELDLRLETRLDGGQDLACKSAHEGRRAGLGQGRSAYVSRDSAEVEQDTLPPQKLT